MKAMVLFKSGTPLEYTDMPIPEPGSSQVLVKVRACGVCRTDLHVIDGDLPPTGCSLPEPKLPLVPGHEIVGMVEKIGSNVTMFRPGNRVGIPWLGYTCGECSFCRSGLENLCDDARFTGYTIDGGYAEYTIAEERYCFPIPEGYESVEAAPLLCAGLIGYRSFVMSGNAKSLGLYGFGAAAHIVIQIALYLGCRVYAFTRPNDTKGQEFALRLGAQWAGSSLTLPPEKLDAAIIFAPVGSLVPVALKAVRKGGVVVCAGIHMSDILSFPYSLLWEERIIKSVANLTRNDGLQFMKLAPEIPIRTELHPYPLKKANEALDDLRNGRMKGAAVLVV